MFCVLTFSIDGEPLQVTNVVPRRSPPTHMIAARIAYFSLHVLGDMSVFYLSSAQYRPTTHLASQYSLHIFCEL
jgi:hypothetical protein